MSWKVETLLLNRAAIRSDYGPGDDVWEDLIMLESQVDKLRASGRITPFEWEVIQKVVHYGSLSEAGKDIGMGRKTLSRYFRAACHKVGFYLGGIYTDEGTIAEMAEKYDLSSDEVEKMREYMNGKYKHRTMRGKDEDIEQD